MALSTEEIRRLVARLMAPTIRRANLMVSRAVVRRIDDGGLMQRLQLTLFGDDDGEDVEVADDVEHVQPYGVSFVPPANSEAVVLAVGGNRDNLVALGAVSRAHRPTGAAEGEGGLYTMEGWKVFCDKDGNVYLGDGPSGTFKKVALAEKVEQELTTLKNAINAATPTPNDGGAALKTAILAALSSWPGSVGSEKVKAVE